jgi:hypothetical protein
MELWGVLVSPFQKLFYHGTEKMGHYHDFRVGIRIVQFFHHEPRIIGV